MSDHRNGQFTTPRADLDDGADTRGGLASARTGHVYGPLLHAMGGAHEEPCPCASELCTLRRELHQAREQAADLQAALDERQRGPWSVGIMNRDTDIHYASASFTDEIYCDDSANEAAVCDTPEQAMAVVQRHNGSIARLEAALAAVGRDRDAAVVKVSQLREALAWYADDSNWFAGAPGYMGDCPHGSEWVPDSGDRARAALEPQQEAP